MLERKKIKRKDGYKWKKLRVHAPVPLVSFEQFIKNLIKTFLTFILRGIFIPTTSRSQLEIGELLLATFFLDSGTVMCRRCKQMFSTLMRMREYSK